MVGADGASRANWYIDGIHPSEDTELSQYRKPIRPNTADTSILGPSLGNLTSSRLVATGRMDFALDRKYNEEAQVMAMEMEGIDIAVLFPTSCLNILARDDMDPLLTYALCRAYNDWLSEFCQYSPDQMKFAAMLPMHDVNLACRELLRAVNELGAVGSFIRPNLINGHYWHSNYWDPLYSLHEDLDVTWGFHEGTGPWYSYMNRLYGENRFYRHVASHWIEMQQAMIAQIIGGVFEFHPKLRVGYLEAQNSWVPGLLTRIEWDYPELPGNPRSLPFADPPKSTSRGTAGPLLRARSPRLNLQQVSSAPSTCACPPTTPTSTPTSPTSPTTSSQQRLGRRPGTSCTGAPSSTNFSDAEFAQGRRRHGSLPVPQAGGKSSGSWLTRSECI